MKGKSSKKAPEDRLPGRRYHKKNISDTSSFIQTVLLVPELHRVSGYKSRSRTIPPVGEFRPTLKTKYSVDFGDIIRRLFTNCKYFLQKIRKNVAADSRKTKRTGNGGIDSCILSPHMLNLYLRAHSKRRERRKDVYERTEG